MENVCNPIVRKLYEAGGSPMGAGGPGAGAGMGADAGMGGAGFSAGAGAAGGRPGGPTVEEVD